MLPISPRLLRHFKRGEHHCQTPTAVLRDEQSRKSSSALVRGQGTQQPSKASTRSRLKTSRRRKEPRGHGLPDWREWNVLRVPRHLQMRHSVPFTTGLRCTTQVGWSSCPSQKYFPTARLAGLVSSVEGSLPTDL